MSPFYVLIHGGMSECRFPSQDTQELFPTVREEGEGKNKGTPCGRYHVQTGIRGHTVHLFRCSKAGLLVVSYIGTKYLAGTYLETVSD